MSQYYILHSEKYVRKLEADREALLEAAKRLRSIFLDNLLDDATQEENEILDAVDAAIAKAEGREAK